MKRSSVEDRDERAAREADAVARLFLLGLNRHIAEKAAEEETNPAAKRLHERRAAELDREARAVASEMRRPTVEEVKQLKVPVLPGRNYLLTEVVRMLERGVDVSTLTLVEAERAPGGKAARAGAAKARAAKAASVDKKRSGAKGAARAGAAKGSAARAGVGRAGAKAASRSGGAPKGRAHGAGAAKGAARPGSAGGKGGGKGGAARSVARGGGAKGGAARAGGGAGRKGGR